MGHAVNKYIFKKKHTHTHKALVLCPNCVPEKTDKIKKV
jgi:hypothetical protein